MLPTNISSSRKERRLNAVVWGLLFVLALFLNLPNQQTQSHISTAQPDVNCAHCLHHSKSAEPDICCLATSSCISCFAVIKTNEPPNYFQPHSLLIRGSNLLSPQNYLVPLLPPPKQDYS